MAGGLVAGDPTALRAAFNRYGGLVHGFFCVVGVGRTQRAAVAEIAALVRKRLDAS